MSCFSARFVRRLPLFTDIPPAAASYPAVEVEAKKTKLAETGHEPQEAGLSSVVLSTADVVDQLKRDARDLANASRVRTEKIKGVIRKTRSDLAGITFIR